jgi:hypothetical protein
MKFPLDTSAEFAQDAYNEATDHRLFYGYEAIESVAQAAKYLLEDGVALHDNLSMSPEKRDTEVAMLNQAFIDSAAPESEMTDIVSQAEVEDIEASFAAPAIAESDRNTSTAPVIDDEEASEKQRLQDEARRLIDEINGREKVDA